MTTSRPRSLLDELERLESLRDPQQAGHRQFRRYVIRGEAQLHPMNRNQLDPTPITVQLRDLSRGGIGFLSPEGLSVGSTWRACFLKEGHVVGEQALMIRHCRAVGESLFLVGGQFIADTGLLLTLGVSPGELREGTLESQDETADDDDYLGPTQV